jgi:hypothetical protein
MTLEKQSSRASMDHRAAIVEMLYACERPRSHDGGWLRASELEAKARKHEAFRYVDESGVVKHVRYTVHRALNQLLDQGLIETKGVMGKRGVVTAARLTAKGRLAATTRMAKTREESEYRDWITLRSGQRYSRVRGFRLADQSRWIDEDGNRTDDPSSPAANWIEDPTGAELTLDWLPSSNDLEIETASKLQARLEAMAMKRCEREQPRPDRDPRHLLADVVVLSEERERRGRGGVGGSGDAA